MLKELSEKAGKSVDLSFLLLFLLKFVVFYYLCKYFIMAWEGVTDPKGLIYLAFFEHYLNFYVFIKAYLFQIPVYMANLFGVHAFQDSVNSLQVETGGRLLVKAPCYGFGLISFWVAFVLADSTEWKRKLLWCISGIACLLTVNILRVTLLLIAKNNQWNIHLLDSYGLNHHTQFNVVAYTLIFLLMFIYYRKNKERLEVRQAS
jgi:exosortase/archaeosortase family protein